MFLTQGTDFGYFGGGRTPTTISTIDRVDYSNDTATAVAKGPLSLAKVTGGGTGNQSFGYFAGGFTTPPFAYNSIVDRINYSNDTATALARGPLSSARYGMRATGNQSFGYFGGGRTASVLDVSTVDRIDYSNDTPTAVEKGH